MPTTSNEAIFDSLVRQQVNLQRLSRGEANKLIRTLDAADKELTGLIASRLVEGQAPDFTTRRWQAMVEEIDRVRSGAIKSINGSIDKSMSGAVDFTVKDTAALYSNAVPVEVNFATPPLATVRELARSTPFGGADMIQTLGEWVPQLADADRGRILGAVRQGVVNGETIPQIVRRVEKVTDLTRQNAEALSRTAVNHAANTGRQEFFDENEEVIQSLRWTATLDGRTSAICRARDGQHDSVEIGGDMEGVPLPHISGSPRRPPAHLRCRSIMIAILDADTLADLERPFVADKRTRRQREKDFRAQAKSKTGKDKWSDMSREQRRDAITVERKQWTADSVGTVPAETTYDEWLRRQPPDFQDEVLGKTKGEAFRNGATMDQYVDRQGNELSIDELREKIPDKMPKREPSLEGPGTPTAEQIKKESRRAEKIAKANEATAKRAKRRADKKASIATKQRKAALRRARKQEEAAKRSEKARKALEKKKLAAEADAKFEKTRRLREQAKLKGIEAERAREALAAGPDELIREGVAVRRGVEADLREKFPDATRSEMRKLRRERLSRIVPPGQDPVKYRKWLDSLSDDEFGAFSQWTTEDQPKLFRDWQRGRPIDPNKVRFAQKNAELLESAIARAPQFEGTLYRGATSVPDPSATFKVGQRFSEGALSSSSFHPGVAAEYASARARSLGRHPVIFRMDNMRRGVNLQNFGDPYEGEVMLSSSARFEVVEVNRVTVEVYGRRETVTEVVLRALP